MVNIPAPRGCGTYVVLVEPAVVKIGTSGQLAKRLVHIRMQTYREVPLLAWTLSAEKVIHSQFACDRIVANREFFRLSPTLLTFVNRCRVDLGFPEVQTSDLIDSCGVITASAPARRLPRVKKEPLSSEDRAKLGRYHTHRRWHREPKAGCEFCTHP